MLKANDKTYQKYYDRITEVGLMALVEKTIKEFDMDGYLKFREKQGYIREENYIQDFIFELLASHKKKFNDNDGFTFSGQLCCKLTYSYCDLSYGKRDTFNYVDSYENRVIVDIRELRKDKILRLVDDERNR